MPEAQPLIQKTEERAPEGTRFIVHVHLTGGSVLKFEAGAIIIGRTRDGSLASLEYEDAVGMVPRITSIQDVLNVSRWEPGDEKRAYRRTDQVKEAGR